MTNHGMAWTAQELELLAAKCCDFTDTELGEQFGRTRVSVRNARLRLGFVHRPREWTALERAALGTLPDVMIAARMGITTSAVYYLRRKLRIKSFSQFIRELEFPVPPKKKKRVSLYTPQDEDWDISGRKRAKNTNRNCTRENPPDCSQK